VTGEKGKEVVRGWITTGELREAPTIPEDGSKKRFGVETRVRLSVFRGPADLRLDWGFSRGRRTASGNWPKGRGGGDTLKTGMTFR